MKTGWLQEAIAQILQNSRNTYVEVLQFPHIDPCELIVIAEFEGRIEAHVVVEKHQQKAGRERNDGRGKALQSAAERQVPEKQKPQHGSGREYQRRARRKSSRKSGAAERSRFHRAL